MIHKEGTPTILIVGLVSAVLLICTYIYIPFLIIPATILLLGFFVFILSFFRNPDRSIASVRKDVILCPCDGKVVVVEETTESEYLKGKCIQISIFMSPLNVHVNRNPISGNILYYKYHPGKFLPAWNPKSSTENERTTIVYKSHRQQVLLMRQIAGAVARRIVCYAKENTKVRQGDDIGFIKFGSRVDLFLPLDTKINVKIGDVVKGNRTVIGEL